jgi:hypothetical protein
LDKIRDNERVVKVNEDVFLVGFWCTQIAAIAAGPLGFA